jgi:hypothetical protein
MPQTGWWQQVAAPVCWSPVRVQPLQLPSCRSRWQQLRQLLPCCLLLLRLLEVGSYCVPCQQLWLLKKLAG